MRTIAPVLLTLAIPLGTALAGPEPTALRDAARSIDAARCRAHVDFLASDLLKGRATPSHEQDIAAAYLVSQFERVGLTPGGDAGSYLQAFPVPMPAELKASALSQGDRAFAYGKDYIPLIFTGSGKVIGAVIFAGYGITSPETNYDDYDGVDVKGKVVLILRHEPRETPAPTAAPGQPQATPGQPPATPGQPGQPGQRPNRRRRFSRHANFAAKIANAEEHGAAALLLVTDPVNHQETGPEGSWPSYLQDEQQPSGTIPALHISLEVAQALLGGRDLAELQRAIDKDLKPQTFAASGPGVTVSVQVERKEGEAHNVVAILRGSDERLRDETLVIGAHYDHLGLRGANDTVGFPGQMGNAVGGDVIYNGADDNASGTSAMLEIARAFAESGQRPRRTIVFIGFAGEELGLLGSAFYVQHPSIPLEKTIGMLNLDMVGRNDPGQVFVGGAASPALTRALTLADETIGLKMTPITDREIGGTSDHESFGNANVPTIFLYTGEHADYHHVTDNPDKIDAEKIARVARLGFLTVEAVADGDAVGAEAAGPAQGTEKKRGSF